VVFVLGKHKKPLMPCSEKRARQLLERGRAVVHRMAPFTIRLKDRTAEESALQPLRLKLDPGSEAAGFAVLREDGPGKSEAMRQKGVVTVRLACSDCNVGDALVVCPGCREVVFVVVAGVPAACPRCGAVVCETGCRC
jgi:hypothetical protein